MNQEDLRKECSRLFRCDTIEDSYEMLNIYSEFFFNAVLNHHEEDVYTNAHSDAKLILQMMLTKTLHLKGMIEGISFTSNNGKSLNNIIDPTVVASLVRNIYETTGLFNLIYRNAKKQDEQNLIYMLWVHSGLKYRQRFEKVIITEKNKNKQQTELKAMEDIVIAIEKNTIYTNLDDENKAVIQRLLKKKEYLIRFENNKVILLHWQELTNIMEIKEGLLDTMYTFFSLYTHPSNVAVFQFGELYQKDTEGFLSMTNFNLHVAFFLLSTFIGDYINLFPTVLKTFESLELKDQIVINFYNTSIRGHEYSINDSYKECG